MNFLTQVEHYKGVFTFTDVLGFGCSSRARICVQINRNTQKPISKPINAELN